MDKTFMRKAGWILTGLLTLSSCAGIGLNEGWDDTGSDWSQNSGQKSWFSTLGSDDSDATAKPLTAGRSPSSSENGSSSEELEAARLRAERQRRAAMQRGDITLGMDSSDVRRTWGHPSDVDVAGDPSRGNERWTYHLGLSTPWSIAPRRVVYFEDGKVVGWETIDSRGGTR